MVNFTYHLTFISLHICLVCSMNNYVYPVNSSISSSSPPPRPFYVRSPPTTAKVTTTITTTTIQPAGNQTVGKGRTSTEHPSSPYIPASKFRQQQRQQQQKRESPPPQPGRLIIHELQQIQESVGRRTPLVVLNYPPMVTATSIIMTTSSGSNGEVHIQNQNNHPDKKFYETRHMLIQEASNTNDQRANAANDDFRGYNYLPPSKPFPAGSSRQEKTSTNTNTGSNNRNSNRNVGSASNNRQQQGNLKPAESVQKPSQGYLPAQSKVVNQQQFQHEGQSQTFQDDIDYGVPPPISGSASNIVPEPQAQSFIEEYGPPGHPNRGKSGSSSGQVRPDAGGSNLPLPQAQNFIPSIDYNPGGNIGQPQTFIESIYPGQEHQQQQGDGDSYQNQNTNQQQNTNTNSRDRGNRKKTQNGSSNMAHGYPSNIKASNSENNGYKYNKPENQLKASNTDNSGYKYSKPDHQLNYLQTQIIESNLPQNEDEVDDKNINNQDDESPDGSSNDGYNYPRPKTDNQLNLPQGSENQNQYENGGQSEGTTSGGYDYTSHDQGSGTNNQEYQAPVEPASSNDQGGYEYPNPGQSSNSNNQISGGYVDFKPASGSSSSGSESSLNEDIQGYEYKVPAASNQQESDGYNYPRPSSNSQAFDPIPQRLPSASENKNYLPPVKEKPSNLYGLPQQASNIKINNRQPNLTPPPGAIRISDKSSSASNNRDSLHFSPTPTPLQTLLAPSMFYSSPSTLRKVKSKTTTTSTTTTSTTTTSRPSDRQAAFNQHLNNLVSAFAFAENKSPMPIIVYGIPFESPNIHLEEIKAPSMIYGQPSSDKPTVKQQPEHQASSSNFEDESRTSRPLMIYGTPSPTPDEPPAETNIHLNREYGTPEPSYQNQETINSPTIQNKELPSFLQVGASCTTCKSKNSFIRMEGPPVMSFITSQQQGAPGYFLPPRPVDVQIPHRAGQYNLFNTNELATDLAEGRIAYIGRANQPKGFIIEIPNHNGGGSFSLIPTINTQPAANKQTDHNQNHQGQGSRLLFIYTPSTTELFNQQHQHNGFQRISRIPIGVRIMSQTGVQRAKSILQSS